MGRELRRKEAKRNKENIKKINTKELHILRKIKEFLHHIMRNRRSLPTQEREKCDRKDRAVEIPDCSRRWHGG